MALLFITEAVLVGAITYAGRLLLGGRPFSGTVCLQKLLQTALVNIRDSVYCEGYSYFLGGTSPCW